MADNIEILCSSWREELKKLEESNNVMSNFCNKLKCVQRGIESSIDDLKSDINKLSVKELSDSVGRIAVFIEENEAQCFIEDKILSECRSMVDRLDFRCYALYLLDCFQVSIKDSENVILRDPMNVRMLAKAVSESKFNFSLERKLFKVYEYIVEYKFRNFPKFGTSTVQKNQENIEFEEVYRVHQDVGMRRFLFNKEQLPGCEIVPRRLRSAVSEVGLLKEDCGYQFLHESFAEYFYSQWLVENINTEYVQRNWLQRVMMEENFANVRKFLNGIVESKRLAAKFSIDLLKETAYFTRCEEAIGSNFHLLAREGLTSIIKLFFNYVNTFPVKISNNLLKLDADKRNVLHIACKNGSHRNVKQLLEFAEKNMSRITMNQLLYERDIDGLGPFQLAVKNDKVQTMRAFFDHYYHKCANKTKGCLLLEQTMFGEKPLLWAAKNNRTRTFKALFLLSEGNLDDDSVRMLLFKPGDCSGTILHAAVYKSHMDVIRQILVSAIGYLSKQDLKKFLFEKDDNGRTVLQAAASSDSMEVVNEMWRFAESILPEEETQEFLMEIDKDRSGNSILQAAAHNVDAYFAKMFCELSKSKLSSQRLKEMVLNANLEGETILHSSVVTGDLFIFNQMWYIAVRTLDADNLRNFLLKTSNEGSNVILKAAHGNNTDLLNKLWNYAKNTLSKESMRIFLFSENKRRENVFTVASLKGNLELMKKAWGLLNEESLDSVETILTQPDTCGNTVLHKSALNGRVDVLKELLGYANSVLGMTSFRNFLLKQNDRDKTCLQIAKIKGNTDFVEHLECYAKNVLSSKSLLDFLDTGNSMDNGI